MAARTQRRSRSKKNNPPRSARIFRQYFPAWAMLAVVLAIMLPNILSFSLNIAGEVIGAIPNVVASIFNNGRGQIAPFFTDEVAYWADDIGRWSREYDLDPNLLATVMQIESCGHPDVSSGAGARGLFQVMPYHFAEGENVFDPETNVKRGAGVLKQCLQTAKGDVGLTLACYNGGPAVIGTPYASWYAETQRYYTWGQGIYDDAHSGNGHSLTLHQWLQAGGELLCDQASVALGLN